MAINNKPQARFKIVKEDGNYRIEKNKPVLKPRRKKKDPRAEKRYIRNKPVKKMCEVSVAKTKEVKFDPLRIVFRRQWDPTYTTTADEPVKQFINASYPEETLMNIPIGNVVFSYTNTDVCNNVKECKQAMRDLLEHSLSNDLPDIPYNFLIGGDGVVYEGRGWRRLPEVNVRFANLHDSNIEVAHFGHEGTSPPLSQSVAGWDLVNLGVRCAVLAFRPHHHTLYH